MSKEPRIPSLEQLEVEVFKKLPSIRQTRMMAKLDAATRQLAAAPPLLSRSDLLSSVSTLVFIPIRKYAGAPAELDFWVEVRHLPSAAPKPDE